MAITIQISDDVKNTLNARKIYERETYNDVVERLIEEDFELTEETKKDIDEAVKRVELGKFFTQEETEKRI
ncbi:hypothetical protein K8R33_00680 [archaeon]|nr:hypothetical protein [archaeon]